MDNASYLLEVVGNRYFENGKMLMTIKSEKDRGLRLSTYGATLIDISEKIIEDEVLELTAIERDTLETEYNKFQKAVQEIGVILGNTKISEKSAKIS